MTIHTHVYVERGGDVSARIGTLGAVVIEVKPGPEEWVGSAAIYVYPNINPELHAGLCEKFGLLQEDAAPAGENGDGERARNEPERAVVPGI